MNQQRKGKVYNTAANYKRVLQYDPLLKGAIRKNLLTERIDIVKPDCPLIGADGNIFNLLGIASRTLREHGLKEQASIIKSGTSDLHNSMPSAPFKA